MSLEAPFPDLPTDRPGAIGNAGQNSGRLKETEPDAAPHPHAPPVRLSQLTSLRFFAAMLVLSSHLWILQEEPNALQPIAVRIFHEGYIGVSFFFMLSGFILSHTYQQNLRTGAVSRTKYLLLRFARIYPLHLMTAAPFAVWLLWSEGGGALPKIIGNLTLLQSWAPDHAFYFTLNAPSWSLSDELFFYAAFAALAYFSDRCLAWIAGIWWAAIALMVGALALTGHSSWFSGGALNVTHWLTYINPAARLLDFLVGMLIYRCARLRLNRVVWTAAEILSVIAVVATMYGLNRLNAPEAVRAQLAYLPLMAAVIYIYAQGGGAISAWLGDARLVFLGEASFSLYMIHLPILDFGARLFDYFDGPIPVVVYAAAIAALCIATSAVVFICLERPIHNRLKRAIGLRLAR